MMGPALPTLGGAMAALSVATDFAMAQSAHFGMRSCALAVRLADAMGWGTQQTRQVYFQALLRYIGCNAESEVIAAVVGDEMAMRRDFAGMDTADRQAVGALVVRRLREAYANLPAWRLAGKLVGTLLTAEKTMAGIFSGHCEVGQRLATRIGFDGETVQAIGQLYERWDGKGQPGLVRGEQVSPAALLVSLAQDVVVHHDAGGVDGAMAVVKQRRGKAYAPPMADVFLRHAASLLADVDALPSGALVDVPGGDEPLDEARFDAICEAMADFVDIKTPWTLSHSSGVATLAHGAARAMALPAQEATMLRRAALLHDVGKVGVSAAVWCKPAGLSPPEREQVRLHAYYTERILSSSPALAPLAEVASLTHDRLDGSGYFRRPPAAGLPVAARILAAADHYHALIEARPHRPAFARADAARELMADARAGRLDVRACEAVLEAAGHAATAKPRGSSLTEREIEVLRTLARGHSMKAIARELGIAPKTVDHHLQRIYSKVGVNTRAGATLYAMEQGFTSALH
jgi:HD-GYP domain-containing protein (c-di-GMP phosphodiesterase class II)